MSKTPFCLTIIGIGFCLQTMMMLGAPSKKSPQKMQTFSSSNSGKNSVFWSWSQQAWTRSDQDFLRVRDMVDSFVKNTRVRPNQRTLLLSKLKQYRAQAEESPKNAFAVFRWAYLTSEARKLDIRPSANGDDIWAINDALEKARPASSYQYDRMLYLNRSRISDYSATIPLGKRLLKRNPKDADVKYFLTRVLSNGNLEEQRLAMRYAQEFARDNPSSLRAPLLLAGIFVDLWNRQHRAADVERAIAQYQNYLGLISQSHSSRSNVTQMVEILKKEKKQFARK